MVPSWVSLGLEVLLVVGAGLQIAFEFVLSLAEKALASNAASISDEKRPAVEALLAKHSASRTALATLFVLLGIWVVSCAVLVGLGPPSKSLFSIQFGIALLLFWLTGPAIKFRAWKLSR